MRTCQKVLQQVQDWAESNEVVRAAILTSSRVKPDAKLDEFSDYDIELYVTALQPFQRNDDWLEAFGSILVRWPYIPRATSFDKRYITRLILFSDYVRIDFQITDITVIEPDRYDDGYQVLIDKDGLTTGLQTPTFQTYRIKPPTREEFETLVNEFWWAAIYVPKYLWRDELPFAKYMLDTTMRYEYLQPVVEWYIGMLHDWSVNPGIYGKWFKQYVDEETWTELESTYTGANIEENWQAFFRFITLFRRLANIVANQLYYQYPVEVDNSVTEYCRFIAEKRG